MNEYKDRGIMKWAPFDALTGHDTVIEELLYNINKQQKKSLSDDEFEEMNQEMAKAISENRNISVEYFQDGYSFQTFGKIKKVDTTNKNFLMDTGERVSFDSVMSLKCVR